jgi:hypothetical protein
MNGSLPVSTAIFWCDELGILNIVEGGVKSLKVVIVEGSTKSGRTDWGEQPGL